MNDTTDLRRAAPDVGGLGPMLTALLLDVPLGLVYWSRDRHSAIIRDDLGVLPLRGGARLISRGLVEVTTTNGEGLRLELTDKGRRLAASVRKDEL